MISSAKTIAVWLAVTGLISWVTWRYQAIVIPPDTVNIGALLETWGTRPVGFFLYLAGIALVIGTSVYVWKKVLLDRRLWKDSQFPRIENYKLIDGLQFGNSTVNVDKEHIELRRERYCGTFQWESISSICTSGIYISFVLINGDQIILGFAASESAAQEFYEIADAALKQSQDANAN